MKIQYFYFYGTQICFLLADAQPILAAGNGNGGAGNDCSTEDVVVVEGGGSADFSGAGFTLVGTYEGDEDSKLVVAEMRKRASEGCNNGCCVFPPGKHALRKHGRKANSTGTRKHNLRCALHYTAKCRYTSRLRVYLRNGQVHTDLWVKGQHDHREERSRALATAKTGKRRGLTHVEQAQVDAAMTAGGSREKLKA